MIDRAHRVQCEGRGRAVTVPFPEGGRDRFARPSVSAAGGGTEQTVLWIAVLEFVRAGSGRPFLVGEVEALIGQLRLWHPSGLWNPDRYAVQLQIPGRDAHQALQRALTCHRDAALAVGMPAMTFVRVEVLTVEEYGRSLQDYDPAGAPTAASAPLGLLCDQVYAATRGLVAATTPRELTDTVIGFVIKVGGRVEPGAPRHLPGTIDVELSIEGDEALHATADTVSVAGLILEQALPALLSDARRALARLREAHLTDYPPQPPTSPDPSPPAHQ